MKYLLAALLLISGISTIGAQHSTKNISIGVEAQGELINTGIENIKPGSGQTINAWLQFPLSQTSTMEAKLGYQNLNGFQQQAVNYTLSNYPTEHQMELNTQQLTGLTYLNFSLNYLKRVHKTSAWSYSLGLRASWLNKVKGEEYNSVYVVSSYYDYIEEWNIGGGYYYGATQSERKRLSKDIFNPLVLGAQARLYYEITRGLQATAGVYQAFLPVFDSNPFAEGRNLWTTSISLGFRARIW